MTNPFFTVPKIHKEVGCKSFKFKAPSDWNKFPSSLKSITTFFIFRSNLFSHLRTSCLCFWYCFWVFLCFTILFITCYGILLPDVALYCNVVTPVYICVLGHWRILHFSIRWILPKSRLIVEYSPVFCFFNPCGTAAARPNPRHWVCIHFDR